MRACTLVYSYYPFDPRVRREVEHLVRCGVDMDVICLREEGELAKEVLRGVTVYRLPIQAIRGGKARYAFQYVLHFLASACLFLRLGLSRRYDVVHVHSLPDFEVFAAWTAKLWGGKIVLDLHELFPEIYMARFRQGAGAPMTALVRYLEAVSFGVADRVLTVNERTRSILVERGCPSEKLDVVMNSPDEKVYREGSAIPEGHTGLRLVYVGGINPERDLEVLIRAVERIARDREVRLLVVGYGPEAHVQALQALVRSLGLEEAVTFQDRVAQEDVLRYLRASDVGVVTYERNPLTEVAVPNKVFEYILTGKPLVLPDLGALRDLFDGAALFYEPGDDGDLADKIVGLWSKNADVEGLLRNAQETYSSSRWAVMGERLERVYAGLLTSGAGRPV